MVNPQKAAAVIDFHNLKHEASGRKIITLLDLLINEIRIDNDTAARESFLKNQGKIEAFIQLRAYFDRDIQS